MKLVLRDSLLFVPVTLIYRGVRLDIDDVLIDTGSATTLLSRLWAFIPKPLMSCVEFGEWVEWSMCFPGESMRFSSGNTKSHGWRSNSADWTMASK
ncbi:hypothetical protein [Allochromatium palmeri]|uniref:Uncharacterized protein n=1 Tax=Allochromatium palmeri TaxID=231048 RepID=A0A6N8EAE6_9GAMM|nr:hypothetical protein [Allochromatium palmeri]MTW20430.1 hypothetical protein [Allochromatium palmeri]